MDNLNRKMRNILNSILTVGTPNMTLKELDFSYFEMTGNKIPHRSLGYGSLLECLRANDDILSVTELNGQFVVRPVVQETAAHIKKLVVSQRNKPTKPKPSKEYNFVYPKVPQFSSVGPCVPIGKPPKEVIPARPTKNSNVNDQLIEVAIKILDEHPSGFPSRKFIRFFEEKTKKDFDLAKFGFLNVVDIFFNLPFEVDVERTSGDYLIRKKGTCKINTTPVAEVSCPPKVYETKQVSKVVIEQSGFNLNTSMSEIEYDIELSEQTLPFTSLGDLIEVIVSEVFSPHLFYVQLRGYDTSEKLNKMMNALQEVYNSNKIQNLKLPNKYCQAGQICCCRYDTNTLWHRAKIIGLSGVEHVMVYYVDYGTIDKVHIGKLYGLKKEFCSLPTQAITARLANTYPVNDSPVWSSHSKAKFLNLVKVHALLAEICGIKNDVLYIALIDTTTKEDIFINDEMILTGHAKYNADKFHDLDEDKLYTYCSSESSANTSLEASDSQESGVNITTIKPFPSSVKACTSKSKQKKLLEILLRP